MGIFDNLIAARSAYGVALTFHIIFASLGVVMPFMLLVSQGLYLRKKDPAYGALNQKWTTAFAITYAIGAVSGTVLTFGFGLFWPRFMNFAGPMIGFPLSVEVLFFLLEAIFLGIYLFGRGLLRPWLHWACALPLFIGGVVSMYVVILANSWMNSPTGYTLDSTGKAIYVNVLQAAFSPAWWAETSHMTVAAFESVGFAFAAVYAFGLLRGKRDEYHRKGFFLGMLVVTLAAPLMIFSGDHTARYVAHNEPAKLAAMEGAFDTKAGAPLTIYGWPDVQTGEVKYGIEVPYLLSILSFDDPKATVQGLNDFPADQRADPRTVHLTYDTMAGIGFFLAAVIPWFWIAYWRSRGVPTRSRLLLGAVTLSGFLGFIATELGWITTEEGRQPWVAQGLMRTSEGFSLAPGMWVGLLGLVTLYLFLSGTLVWLLKHIADGGPSDGELREERSKRSEEGAYAT